MSDEPDATRVNIGRVRFAFFVLFLVGFAVMLWGFVGLVVIGATFAEVIVDELGLPKQPETYSKLATLYAEHEQRKGFILAILGLLILLPAAFGFWAAGGVDRMFPHDKRR